MSDLPAYREALLKELDRFTAETMQHYNVHPDALDMSTAGGRTIRQLWDKLRNGITAAPSDEAARVIQKQAMDRCLTSCLALWANGYAPGPETTSRLLEQANKAERYAERTGSELHVQKADALRRKAAGEDVTVPSGQRNGAVWKVRELYTKLAAEGKSRKEMIEAAVAEGINRNTAQTQYYRWKEKT